MDPLPSILNPRLPQIAELESQLVQLRHEGTTQQPIFQEPRAQGMYDPTPHLASMGGESASGIAESVEILFPGGE